ncbi:MAG: glycosyltransferase family 1 protein [Termitinemataceae bacterium]|nr:MAG: glycosyltransferase family 1 protein [Termitinemataceae bacterium]
MHIAIDCRMYGSSGIGTYITGCLPYFLSSCHSFTLICSGGTVPAILKMCARRSNYSIVVYNKKPFSMQELFFLPNKIAKKINECDLYYSPFFNIPQGINIPIYTTIHDVIFPDMPELTSKIGLTLRMWFYKRACKKSKKIFTVSEFSASRIRHHFESQKKLNIIVTYNGVQEQLLNINTAFVQKQKTIIFVGNIKKHKGLQFLLEAFLKAQNELSLQGQNYRLLILGQKENFRSKDKTALLQLNTACNSAEQRGIKYGSNKNQSQLIEFSGVVDAQKLKILLSEASLLVQPSLYEGFCYPPLEALFCATNVLISDIPVLKEIYGGYPVTFFRAGDVADLKEKLIAILKNGIPAPVELSKELKQKYTFEKTAAAVLSALDDPN